MKVDFQKTCHVDFETRCAVKLQDVGAYRYTRHKSFGPICLGWSWRGVKKLLIDFTRIDPDLLVAALDPDAIFCAHNVHFDRQVWEIVMVPLGYPSIPLDRWRCTMAKAYAHGLPAKLETCALVLKLTSLKDMTNQAKAEILFSPKPIWEWDYEHIPEFYTVQEKPAEYAAMYKYCLGDIDTLIALDCKLPHLIEIEQEIWEMDQRINDRGIYVDINLVRRAMALNEEWQDNMAARFREIQLEHRNIADIVYGVIGPRQRELVKGWLSRRGHRLPNLQKNTLRLFLKRVDIPDFVREVVEIYQSCGKSSLAKYPAMLNYADQDGIIRELAQYHGSHTGRWAHRGVQFGNMTQPEYPMDQLCSDIETYGFKMFKLLYPEVTRALSSAIRGMVTPRE